MLPRYGVVGRLLLTPWGGSSQACLKRLGAVAPRPRFSVRAKAQRQGWGVIALDVQVDTSTASGEAMANMLATFAQFERRLIGQRIRKSTRSDGAYRLGSAELTRGNPPEPGLT